MATMMVRLVSGSRLFWLLPKLTASLSPHERGTEAARGERLFLFRIGETAGNLHGVQTVKSSATGIREICKRTE